MNCDSEHWKKLYIVYASSGGPEAKSGLCSGIATEYERGDLSTLY